MEKLFATITQTYNGSVTAAIDIALFHTKEDAEEVRDKLNALNSASTTFRSNSRVEEVTLYNSAYEAPCMSVDVKEYHKKIHEEEKDLFPKLFRVRRFIPVDNKER